MRPAAAAAPRRRRPATPSVVVVVVIITIIVVVTLLFLLISGGNRRCCRCGARASRNRAEREKISPGRRPKCSPICSCVPPRRDPFPPGSLAISLARRSLPRGKISERTLCNGNKNAGEKTE